MSRATLLAADPLGSVGAALLAAVLLGAAACDPGGDQRTESLDPETAREQRATMPPEAVAHLDSGNVAFRADDFESARRHFESVTELAPAVAAGWFGLYLAERALGNADAAERALERAREVAPGRSLIHPEGEGG